MSLPCQPLRDGVLGRGRKGSPRTPFPMERKCRFLFLVSTTRDSVLHCRARPDNPMAKLSKKSRCPEAPAPVSEPAPRVARRREGADQRLRRFGFLSCFRISPEPLNKFVAETARPSRPEMAPQRLEKTESAPGNGMVSDAPSHKIWYTATMADHALRLRAARLPKLTIRRARKFSASQPVEIARNREGISKSCRA
jgi:hypothetical protein